MEIPDPADWRHIRLTIQTAGSAESLAERVADLAGVATAYSVTAFWDTGLDELGVTSQEGGRVEVIVDPLRAVMVIDRVTEWATEQGLSTFLVEISVTYPFLFQRGD